MCTCVCVGGKARKRCRSCLGRSRLLGIGNLVIGHVHTPDHNRQHEKMSSYTHMLILSPRGFIRFPPQLAFFWDSPLCLHWGIEFLLGVSLSGRLLTPPRLATGLCLCRTLPRRLFQSWLMDSPTSHTRGQCTRPPTPSSTVLR